MPRLKAGYATDWLTEQQVPRGLHTVQEDGPDVRNGDEPILDSEPPAALGGWNAVWPSEHPLTVSRCPPHTEPSLSFAGHCWILPPLGPNSCPYRGKNSIPPNFLLHSVAFLKRKRAHCPEAQMFLPLFSFGLHIELFLLIVDEVPRDFLLQRLLQGFGTFVLFDKELRFDTPRFQS